MNSKNQTEYIKKSKNQILNKFIIEGKNVGKALRIIKYLQSNNSLLVVTAHRTNKLSLISNFTHPLPWPVIPTIIYKSDFHDY